MIAAYSCGARTLECPLRTSTAASAWSRPTTPASPILGTPYDHGVSVRELVVLGTASQAPTRTRNHNGYLLRWDGEGILFDPGEGTQRQMIQAGVASVSSGP